MTALHTQPEIHATIGVKGRYKLIRRKAVMDDFGELVAGDIVEETPWCKNILTLYYFNQAMTNANMQALSCVVGTGNATPLETNTALQSFLAGTITVQTTSRTSNATVSPRYVKFSRTYRFGAGVAAGNVAEVGVCLIGTVPINTTPIVSRALVVDGGGTPTTVTVLSDEFLDVIWECTWYTPEDVTGSFNMTIDGVVTAFNYTVRGIALDDSAWTQSAIIGTGGAALVSSSDGSHSINAHSGVSTASTLTAYDAEQSVSVSNRADSTSSAAYVADSKQRSFTLNWGLNYGNIAIRTIYVMMGSQTNTRFGNFQVLLNNPVTKINTKIFSFTFVVSMANVP